MQVVSVNIGEKTPIQWKGKTEFTGIFKKPVKGSIHLGFSDVNGDIVHDRKYHGGEFKACYLFSADHYQHWKNAYPELDFEWGMFGENVTVKNFQEKQCMVGDIYRLGGATVQAVQPREPCYKLGIRFGTQKVLKDFIEYGSCGVYLKVWEEGAVQAGDELELVERQHNSMSFSELWNLMYHTKDKDELEFALSLPFLAEGCKNYLRKLL